MEQDTATSGGAFVPASLEDILRPDQTERDATPAGQPAEASPPPEQSGETGEAAQATPAESAPRDPETGRFAPKQPEEPTAEAGPPPVANEPQKSVPLSAVLEERKKRQALEAELAAFRAAQQPQAAPQQPAAPQVPLTDLMFQNPEQFVQALQQRQEEALLQTRIATSEAIARQQADYDAAEQALTAYAQSSPRAAAEVAQALRSHPAPAMWAYQAGKHLLAQSKWAPVMQQHSDPDAWINAEVERRLAARQSAAPASSSAPSPRLPGTLADVRSSGTRAAAQAQTYTPLDEIARFKG